MNRFRPYLNRFVKQKELDITDIYHDLNMKQIRPITTKLMQHSQTYTINNSKKEMIREVRDFQIERENKMLLGKIESVMAKRGSYSVAKTKSINTKLNKSLNDIYRKKQLQSIQLENKRFLLRLQSKKPTVNTMKLRKDWQDNKSVIKRMANHQFNLTHFKTKDSRMRSLTSQRMFRQKYQDIKISKFKVIDGHKMLIKIEFADGFLKIVGDSRDHKDLKVIDIPKDEAVIFLEKDCDGKAERLLDKLRYDEKTETLYLVSETIEETNDFGDLNPQGAKIKIKNRTNSVHENRQKRQSKSTLQYITSVNQPNDREDLYMNHIISHKMNDRARLSSKELIKPSTHEIINFEQQQEIMPDAKMEKQQENEANNSQAIENLFQ